MNRQTFKAKSFPLSHCMLWLSQLFTDLPLKYMNLLVMFILNFSEKGFLPSFFLPSFTLVNPSFEILRYFFWKYLTLILQKKYSEIRVKSRKYKLPERITKRKRTERKRTERKNVTMHFFNEINNKRPQWLGEKEY